MISRITEQVKGYNLTAKSLAALAVVQFLVIVWFNTPEMQLAHLGNDAAVCYTNAMEIWTQGRLFISDWTYTTTLNLDNVVPVAAFFFWHYRRYCFVIRLGKYRGDGDFYLGVVAIVATF